MLQVLTGVGGGGGGGGGRVADGVHDPDPGGVAPQRCAGHLAAALVCAWAPHAPPPAYQLLLQIC